MANTPIRFGQQRAPLEVLVSPQSAPQRKLHKRLSACLSLQQSPDLPEVRENELNSARQRRHSRNFTPLLKNTTISGEEVVDGKSSARWTKDQLLQHYAQCMKLFQENKINHKNAFDLQLIEHMGEMIKQDGTLNFRVAGGTIFAGAKIYASRVDAIHSEIYRVLNSLSSGDKEDNCVDDENAADDNERKAKKRKKTSKVLVTNEAVLRVASHSCDNANAMARLRSTAIDAANCDSLLVNQVSLCSEEAILQYNYDTSLLATSGANKERCVPEEASQFHDLLSNRRLESNLTGFSLCPTFQEFNFNSDTPMFDFDRDVDSDQAEKDLEQGTCVNAFDFDATEEDTICDDPFDPEGGDGNVFPTSINFALHDNQNKPKEISDAMDLVHLVAVAPPAEYSYFKPSVLSVCDGPSHWLRHRSARSAPSLSTAQTDSQPSSASQPKKRKTAEKKSKKIECGKFTRDKRIQPQKMSKAKIESLRTSMQDRILLESTDLHSQTILKATELKVILRKLTDDMIRKTDVIVDSEAEVENFKYANDDYCPAAVDSDYDDDNSPVDASRDLFPSSSEGFFPDFTQNATSLTPTTEMSGGDYAALLDGDHLISQPRKVEKVQVHFAKRAKRIDVRRLKSAMWRVIKPEEMTNPLQDNVTTSEDASAPKETPAASKEKDTNDVDKDGTREGSLLFSSLYETLPNIVSKNMSENLSVPLAFTCLLHLANEKQLKIEGTPSLGDLKITQDI